MSLRRRRDFGPTRRLGRSRIEPRHQEHVRRPACDDCDHQAEHTMDPSVDLPHHHVVPRPVAAMAQRAPTVRASRDAVTRAEHEARHHTHPRARRRGA